VLDIGLLSSPLALPAESGREAPASASAVLRERPFLGKIMLQLDPRDDRLAATAGLVLGFPLPARGCVTGDGNFSTLRLSPQAHLIVTPVNEQYESMARLKKALAGGPAAVSDVSSGYATFRISGPAAAELLYRGCPVSLEPPDFAPGNCLTTSFGKLTVVIHCVGVAEGIDLYVQRSLALSLWNGLVEAGCDSKLMIGATGTD
jgi:sarcosine oxidase, subunit gamma